MTAFMETEPPSTAYCLPISCACMYGSGGIFLDCIYLPLISMSCGDICPPLPQIETYERAGGGVSVLPKDTWLSLGSNLTLCGDGMGGPLERSLH